MSGCRVRSACMLLGMLVPVVTGMASSPWSPAVGRTTNDRDADLIDALVRAGRFDDALSICESQQRAAARESDDAAKWAIRRSRVLSARQLGLDRFEDADVQRAQQPIRAVLESYPEHRRRHFLEAQQVMVGRDGAMHSVLRAAVSPSGDSALDSATKRLLRATTAMESLFDKVGSFRSQLEGQATARDFQLQSDLARLQQELQVNAVSLALMQTELFPRGSNDAIAAATKAEQAAEDAIARLPADTPARREVERLKVESILRANQFDRASAALDELTRALGDPMPPRVRAMHVRLDLARGKLAPAGAQLDAYFGKAPAAAPPSLEMDLARLEFLLLGNQAGGVGPWLDAIEKRGGGYARRRAEAISLASLKSGQSRPGAPMIDPSLIAAQGQDWLRRGEPGRAAELLSAAAAAESDPSRAIRRATEAAAALVSAGRPSDAAQVLADISLAKSKGDGAAAAHLQAALMIASTQGENLRDQLELMLRANLQTWPSGDSANAARRWLQKLLVGQARHVEAAVVATAVPADEITRETAASMIDLWRVAFRSIRDDDSRTEASQQFRSSFGPLQDNALIRPYYRLGAALLLDRDSLASLPDGQGNVPEEILAEAILQFRRQGVVSDPLREIPSPYVDDATSRLMRDARTYPQLRSPVAQLISIWKGDSQESLERAEMLLWTGNTEGAVDMVRRLVRVTPRSMETTSRAARLLGSSDDAGARDAAIKIWDELAAGSKQGSRTWHEAKLAGIKLLRKTGQNVEAQRRAKYILLTTPVIDQPYKRQYQAASQ